VSTLDPGVLVAAASLDIPLSPLPDDEVVEGSPSAGSVVLDDAGDIEFGVWEMTPGTATDTEVDEVFIVISGRATVLFEGLPSIEIAPGAVVRLTEGMRTTWVVHETLRKIYVA